MDINQITNNYLSEKQAKITQKQEKIAEEPPIELPTNEEIENKLQIIAELSKFQRLHERTKEKDILIEIGELESKLKRITDYEIKIGAYIERESIINENEKEQFQTILKETFLTDFTPYEVKCVLKSDIKLPAGMILTEDGFLTGIEARYGIENCINPYGNEYAERLSD